MLIDFKSGSIIFLLCAFFSSLAGAEQGDDAALFQQRSQHAYNSVFGLPAVAPRLVQTAQWQISLEHSNQFLGGQAAGETLVLDGESTEIFFRHRQRLSACWQLNADIPFIAHGRGLFDRAIDDWHQFFGLPDGQRDQTDYFQLDYSYTDETGQQHAITSPQSGIGDIQLSVQRSLGCFATADSTSAESIVRFGLKLPTGNPNELRGSGEFDVYADLQSPVWSNRGRWKAGASLGVLKTGSTQRFARQKGLVVYGSAGVQFVLSHRTRLIAQLDGHSGFYNSAVHELGSASMNLAVGVRYLARSDQTIEFSISEDAAIDTTPDIVARIAWTIRPRGHLE